MDLPDKVNKLYKTKDPENIKLATNIIVSRVKKENVIAFISILKTNELFDLCEQNKVITAINSILEKQIPEIATDSINYSTTNLLRWSMQSFKSVDNIDYAHHLYLKYISSLVDKSKKELLLEHKDNVLIEKHIF